MMPDRTARASHPRNVEGFIIFDDFPPIDHQDSRRPDSAPKNENTTVPDRFQIEISWLFAEPERQERLPKA